MDAPRGSTVEPRVETIEGKRTTIVQRTPPLPPRLPELLGQMFLYEPRADIIPRGARASCEALREHRLERLAFGSHVGTDGARRDLLVAMCADCGAACVRDVSVDRLSGLPIGRGGPRRRDVILGWYTGKRRSGREYR